MQHYDRFINQNSWDDIIPDNIITLSQQDKDFFQSITPDSEAFYENIINGLTYYAMSYLSNYLPFF